MKIFKSLIAAVLLVAFSPIFVHAQTVTCGDIIGKVNVPNQLDCYRYEFPFFLRLENLPGDESFETCYLSITGSITGGSSATLNEGLTLPQVHPNLAGGTLTITGNQFEYLFDGDANDMIEIPLGNGNYLLTIVGEAWPGDELQLYIDDVYFFINCDGGQCHLNNSPNSDELQEHAPITMPQPQACMNTDWELTLGTEVITGEQVSIPVLVNSTNGISLSEVDFHFKLSDDFGIAVIDEVQTLASAPAGTLSIDGEDFYYHDVSLSSSPIFYPNGTVLFEIVLNAYAGTTVNFTTDFARMKDFNTAECCAPDFTFPSVNIPGNAPCLDPGVICDIGTPDQEADCQLSYPVFMTLTEEPIDVVKLFFEIEVDLEPGMSINVAETESSITSQLCFGPCPLFPELGDDCINIDGNTISYGFCNPNGFAVSDAILFSIIIEGAIGGCVPGIKYTSAEIDILGQAICTPETVDYEDEVCLNGIKGNIVRHCDLVPVPEVTVPATSNNFPACTSFIEETDTDGFYGECVCDEDGTIYHIEPTKDSNVRCGISTYDLFLISKHILSIDPLSSPYDIIAADVNCSGTVTTFDMVQMRKLILFISNDFPNCESWEFVDASYDFPVPLVYPLTFPDFIDVELPNSDPADFIAIKKGDINCSCDPEDFLLAGEVEIAMENQSLRKGESFTLQVKGNRFSTKAAFEMGLRFSSRQLKFQRVHKGNLPGFDANNFNLEEAARGNIRAIWHGDKGRPVSFREGQTLFQLDFVAQEDIADLSTVISLDDGLMNNYAYTENGDTYSMKLNIKGGKGDTKGDGRSADLMATTSDLLVSPNPINGDVLNFTFTLPQSGKVLLKVYDLLGREIVSQEQTLDAGLQSLNVTGLSDWETGIYTYSLAMDNTRLSGKVVKP